MGFGGWGLGCGQACRQELQQHPELEQQLGAQALVAVQAVVEQQWRSRDVNCAPMAGGWEATAATFIQAAGLVFAEQLWVELRVPSIFLSCNMT